VVATVAVERRELRQLVVLIMAAAFLLLAVGPGGSSRASDRLDAPSAALAYGLGGPHQ
jgi:hypothetical protein